MQRAILQMMFNIARVSLPSLAQQNMKLQLAIMGITVMIVSSLFLKQGFLLQGPYALT